MNKKLLQMFVLLALLLALLPAAALAQGGTVYTAQKDDTLVKLAQKEYNNPLAFQAIVYYNNEKAKTDTTLFVIEDPKATLTEGSKIYLPTAAEVESFLASGGAEPAVAAPVKLSGELQLAGSTSVQPLAELLAAEFMKANPEVKVTVQGGGSGVGVTSAAEGTAAIGNVSRDLKNDEKVKFPALVQTRIAIDGLTVVVNPSVTGVTNLTLDQVRKIFAGQITNFKDVGGPDAAIVVVTREEGSGTRDFFQEAVMGKEAKISEKALVQQSNGQVRTTVASTPNAIGFLSFGFMDTTTTPVNIEGAAPTVDNVKNGSYKLWRNFNMVTQGSANKLAQAFFDFIFSPAGQAIVAKEWIAVEKSAAPTFACPAGAAGTLKLAGSTSVQPLAEKFAGDFMKACPGVKVEVSGGGSGVGVTSAYNMTADIGDVSRDLSSSEKSKMPELKATRIAVDGVALVVNPGVTLPTLSLAQAKDIFSGKITNFKDVGGPDASIIVVTREEGSGTRDFFQEKVMGKDKITEKALVQQSNGQVRTTVASTPNSIGYVSFGFIDNTTKPVALDNVQPTSENVLNNTYPMWRYFNMVTRGQPNYLAQIFLNFIFSPQGHDTIITEGYMTHAPN